MDLTNSGSAGEEEEEEGEASMHGNVGVWDIWILAVLLSDCDLSIIIGSKRVMTT